MPQVECAATARFPLRLNGVGAAVLALMLVACGSSDPAGGSESACDRLVKWINEEATLDDIDSGEVPSEVARATEDCESMITDGRGGCSAEDHPDRGRTRTRED